MYVCMVNNIKKKLVKYFGHILHMAEDNYYAVNFAITANFVYIEKCYRLYYLFTTVLFENYHYDNDANFLKVNKSNLHTVLFKNKKKKTKIGVLSVR